ncbi:MAG: hypothetical protein AB8B82_13325 [Roseovarius sp.]
MPKTVLILDADSPLGDAAATTLWNAGWAIHLFDGPPAALAQSAKGVDVIVANTDDPTGPTPHQIQAAAQACGATVIAPLSITQDAGHLALV